MYMILLYPYCRIFERILDENYKSTSPIFNE